MFTIKGCSLIRGVHYERFHCIYKLVQAHINYIEYYIFIYVGKKNAGVLKYENYIECTNNMATFNRCDRILKADVCLVKLYLKTMDNRVFPRNNKVWAHGPMSLKFDGPFL